MSEIMTKKPETVLTVPYGKDDTEMAVITREGKNDYSVYFTKSGYSVRGTLLDIIREITKKFVSYENIKKIQGLLWKDDDRMDQETLFDAQEEMADFALEVARFEGECEDLVKTFPWLYNVKEEKTNV